MPRARTRPAHRSDAEGLYNWALTMPLGPRRTRMRVSFNFNDVLHILLGTVASTSVGQQRELVPASCDIVNEAPSFFISASFLLATATATTR